MSFASFPQAQTLNPPPPPPLGLTVMTPAGPQLPGAQFEQAAQLQMITNPGQPPLPSQQAAMQHQLHQMQQQMQQMQHLMHPAMNDAPLEFNMNKNKPPIPTLNEEQNKQSGSSSNDEMLPTKRSDDRGNDRRDHRDRDRRERERDRDRRNDRRDRSDRDRDREDIKDRRDDSSKSGPVKMGIDMAPSPGPNLNPTQNPSGGILPNTVQMMGVSPMIGMMGSMMGHPMMPMMGGMISDPAMLGMAGMGQKERSEGNPRRSCSQMSGSRKSRNRQKRTEESMTRRSMKTS